VIRASYCTVVAPSSISFLESEEIKGLAVAHFPLPFLVSQTVDVPNVTLLCHGVWLGYGSESGPLEQANVMSRSTTRVPSDRWTGDEGRPSRRSITSRLRGWHACTRVAHLVPGARLVTGDLAQFARLPGLLASLTQLASCGDLQHAAQHRQRVHSFEPTRHLRCWGVQFVARATGVPVHLVDRIALCAVVAQPTAYGSLCSSVGSPSKGERWHSSNRKPLFSPLSVAPSRLSTSVMLACQACEPGLDGK